MKNVAFLISFSFVFALLGAQEKKELDRQAIKDMCGCYEITFKYTETFAPEIDYEKKMDYTAGALELALPIVDEENKISIQHLLVVNDSMVIKHWRQDWEYENQKVFHYDKDNNWVFKTLPAEEVKGQWTQKVFQVDDSPRYSGSATWIHADGKHYWENKTDSPLPRREYTKRKDYNVMLRGNRQEITEYGWLHEQDNDKVVRADGEEDLLLAQEKGMNTYTKVADEKCKLAKDWWASHNGFWANVRTAWDEVYNREGDLTLAKKVDEKPLFMHFYPLEKAGADNAKINEVISKFVLTKETSDASEGK
ncbi:DUF6607 family protein [Flagellimonas eckloniae]|uniref:Uncharacterized protein n=1 Tax=Flagellimonas eckloniae TaxID=346185 RepID=A0A0Q0X0H9_9FLAO|nr:DUF6607 family protein [Allomuricauda eckloniae]KQC31140.1 hypothetical protein AAY42_15500 [Allomuricauda eckloniae]